MDEISHHEIIRGGDLSPCDHKWVRSLAIRLNVGEISRHEITCG